MMGLSFVCFECIGKTIISPLADKAHEYINETEVSNDNKWQRREYKPQNMKTGGNKKAAATTWETICGDYCH